MTKERKKCKLCGIEKRFHNWYSQKKPLTHKFQ